MAVTSSRCRLLHVTKLNCVAFVGLAILICTPAFAQSTSPQSVQTSQGIVPVSTNDDAADTAERLREAIDKIKQRLAERKAAGPQPARTELKAELSAAQEQIASLQDEVGRLRNERDEALVQATALGEQSDASTEANLTVDDGQAALEKQLEDAKQRASALEDEVSATKSELAARSEEITRLEAKLVAGNRALSDAEDNASAQEDLSAQLSDAEVEIASLRAGAETQTDELTSLSDALAASEAAKAILESELEEARLEVEMLKEALIASEQLIAPEAADGDWQAAHHSMILLTRQLRETEVERAALADELASAEPTAAPAVD